jgi:hypothetical protein
MIAAALRIALAWLIVCAVVVASVWAATRRALRPADMQAIQDAEACALTTADRDYLNQLDTELSADPALRFLAHELENTR